MHPRRPGVSQRPMCPILSCSSETMNVLSFGEAQQAECHLSSHLGTTRVCVISLVTTSPFKLIFGLSQEARISMTSGYIFLDTCLKEHVTVRLDKDVTMSWTEADFGAAWCADHLMGVWDTPGSSLHCMAASGGPWNTLVFSQAHAGVRCAHPTSPSQLRRDQHSGPECGGGVAFLPVLDSD